MPSHPIRCIARHAALLLLALCAACGGPSDRRDAIVTRDSSGVAIIEHDLTQLVQACELSPTPTVSIGVDDGDDEYVLHRVFGATRLSDGTLVLVNGGTQELRFFGTDGRFLRSAGRKGQGPGEFSDAFYIHWMPGDTLYVGDYRPFQFLVFAPDGRWLRTVRPTPLYPNTPGTMNVLADGRMMLATDVAFARDQASAFKAREMTVLLHRADGTLSDTIATVANGRWGQSIPGPQQMWLFPLFEAFPVMAARDDRLVFGHASETELRVHRASAGYPVERVIRWTSGDRTVRAVDISAERERLVKQYAELSEQMRTLMVDPLVSENRPVADSFPAFGRLRIGRDGRLWIREFPRPRDPDEHRWIAFGADGRFDCRMTTPRFSDVLEVGADYLLTHERDSLGVERVRQYALRRR